MSFALEFYSLSWDALKSALTQRKPELIAAVQAQQWDRLVNDTDLVHNDNDAANADVTQGEDVVFADGFDEIAEAMAQKVPPGRDPADVGDNAALVVAAMIRHLGKPVGAIQHAASVIHDKDGEVPMDFYGMFLDGVAGSAFNDHGLGDKLMARPLFGLFHLDFLSWGGLTQAEIAALMPKYALTPATKQDEEWLAIADHAQGWLDTLVAALTAAATAKSDLVTLYLTSEGSGDTFWDELRA
ncbi:MAG TPA: hypothetical protein VGP50_02385 [Stellaceae bacterium]|jgi:hypothetical protein|nr:hypothetical protein [Stellaceae bacterium]